MPVKVRPADSAPKLDNLELLVTSLDVLLCL